MLHLRLRTVIWFIVLFVGVYFLYFSSALNSISTSFPKVYFPDDSETNFMISLVVSRGGGLYKDFSIVYPPGRFLIEGLLFRLFSPTLPLTLIYFAFFKILFTIVLFFLSKKIIDQFINLKSQYKRIVAHVLGLLSVFIYMSFINSAQEVHVFVALFFLGNLYSNRTHKFQILLLGGLLGLVFLFRIDAGILLTFSLIISRLVKPSQNCVFSKYFFAGFLVVWIPVLLLITIHGSLSNFLYDTFYLGLVIQPRMMSLALPPPPVGKIFWAIMIFTISAGSALALHAHKLKDKTYSAAIMAFCLYAVLSFAAALGRSDEAHLWYGSIWMSIFVTYVLLRFTAWKQLLTFKVHLVLASVIMLLLLTFTLLHFKNPTLYLVVAAIFFIISIKQNIISSFLLLSSGVVATLIIFHSAAYVKLIFHPPHPSFRFSFSPEMITTDHDELAGMKLSKENTYFLDTISHSLNQHDSYLFIYPDSVLYYEYFQLKNPTRHYYHTGETTEKLQQEIITDLQKTNTKQFLVFPNKVTYKGSVWNWILKNTRIKNTVEIENLKAEVRIKN